LKFENTSHQFNRKIENLQSETNRQFYDIQLLIQKRASDTNTNSTGLILLEKRIENLHNDSDKLQRTLNLLKNQLEEVQNLYKLINLQNKQRNEDLVNRIEGKITQLQSQITGIETQLKSQPRQKDYTYGTTSVLTQNLNPAFSSSYKFSSGFDVSPNPIPVTNISEKTDLTQTRPLTNSDYYGFTADLTAPKEEPKSSYKPSTFNSGVFNSSLQNASSTSNSELKYYGDPKVRSIIEEFYQKRTVEPTSKKKLVYI
jgi:hypothetical protein